MKPFQVLVYISYVQTVAKPAFYSCVFAVKQIHC